MSEPERCEICDQPLADDEPWQRGLDGSGAHLRCLDVYPHPEPEEEG